MGEWIDSRGYAGALARVGIDAGPEGQSYVPATQLTYALNGFEDLSPRQTRFMTTYSRVAVVGRITGIEILTGFRNGIFIDGVTNNNASLNNYAVGLLNLLTARVVGGTVPHVSYDEKNVQTGTSNALDLGAVWQEVDGTNYTPQFSFALTSGQTIFAMSFGARLYVPPGSVCQIISTLANVATSFSVSGTIALAEYA